MSENVKVAVRCRPMNDKENFDKRHAIISVDTDRGEILVRNPKSSEHEPPKPFTYDHSYGADSVQEQIYCDTAYPIVESVLGGYNGTIFAYGQTGTGKTHTMEGKAEPPELRGITPRAFEQIFYGIEQHPDSQFLIRGSFLEIYNEEIFDLLGKHAKHRLDIKEDRDTGFYVKDLTTIVVKNIHEMKEVMDKGRTNRHVGETQMNRESSRSHCIFTITIETSAVDETGMTHYRVGKLNLVDLAGSERQSKTGSAGDQLKEATNINKSLLTLGNVISKLVDGQSTHIPYRDSKLTKLLQDSLGGNTKTVMIANIGPADWNYDETISTLRYANRAKSIKNIPKVNEDPKDALLRQFQEEISRLKEQLQWQGSGMSQDPSYSGAHREGEAQIVEIEKVVRIEDPEKIQQMEAKIQREKEEIRLQAESRKCEIEQQMNLAEDQKRALLEELHRHTEETQKAKDQQSQVLKQLKNMEDKMVQGHQLMEQAVRQEQELQKAKMELETCTQQERALAREVERQEEENFHLKSNFSSQKDEIEDKNKKLRKLYSKYQVAQSEIKDLSHEFQLERQDLVDTIRVLSQQLKLNNLVLDNFVPLEEQKFIEDLAHWNEDAEEWMVPRPELTGNYVRNHKTLKKRSSNKDAQNYDGIVSQRVQNTVQNILQEYNDEATVMPIDTHPNVYFVYTDEGAVREENDSKAQREKRLKTAKRPGTAPKKGKKHTTNKEGQREVYPEARGLVSRGGVS